MEAGTDQPPPLVNSPSETSPLLRVCALLNEARAKYLVAGAYAMTLNSVILIAKIRSRHHFANLFQHLP